MDKNKLMVLNEINKSKFGYLELEELEEKGYGEDFLQDMIEEGLVGRLKTTFHLAGNGRTILQTLGLIESFKQKKTKVMFDNDIINKIAEGIFNINEINDNESFEFYITHIQVDQASRCKDEEKRAKLMISLFSLKPIIIGTESFVLDTSRLGLAKLGDAKTLENLRQDNNKHTEDSLIGESAINNKILLVTNDKTLRSRVTSNGGKVMSLEEFIRLLKK